MTWRFPRCAQHAVSETFWDRQTALVAMKTKSRSMLNVEWSVHHHAMSLEISMLATKQTGSSFALITAHVVSYKVVFSCLLFLPRACASAFALEKFVQLVGHAPSVCLLIRSRAWRLRTSALVCWHHQKWPDRFVDSIVTLIFLHQKMSSYNRCDRHVVKDKIASFWNVDLGQKICWVSCNRIIPSFDQKFEG